MLEPDPPGTPLDDSSHSGRDSRRLQHASSRTMPPSDSAGKRKKSASQNGGKARSLGDGGTPNSQPAKRRPSKKKEQQHARRNSPPASDDEGEGKSLSNSQLKKKLRQLQKMLEENGGGKARKSTTYAADSDDDSYEDVRVPRLVVGDPSNDKDPMYQEVYTCMLEKGYRVFKFINHERHEPMLVKYIMDRLDIPALTLTGNKDKDPHK